MANRRQGYGGGAGGGGRSYYNSGPVNPWQGGNMPGNQGGPFNSVNPANLLSQLSEPQAQLALALTNLLQPQQQVPSLLSMNTVGPLRNNTIYRQNNYGPRGRDMNRRTRSDPKRNEPYKKMHNRRDSDNNRRRPNTNNKSQAQNKSNSNSKSSSSSSSANKPSAKVEKATDDTAKTVAHDIKEEKPEPGTTADSESKDVDTKSDVEDNGADVKVMREWKIEKDDENDESSAVVKKEDGNKNDTAKTVDLEDEHDEGSINLKYAGIPATLLHCYICEKKMWDGESFEKHINGRAHQQMFEKHKESYRIKVDIMRQAIRLAEERNHIELDRMKRLGKKTKSHHMSHCAMCDLDFHGQLFSHRKTSSHQKLKHYLHPRCAYCNKEFPNRMDWEIHRHSIRHLRKEANQLDKKKGKVQPEEDEIEIDDECFVVLDSIENDDEDESNVVTDLTDDLNESEIHLPTYKPKRSVGLSLITSVTGFYCKPCSRFFINEQASKQHAQSKKHFESFIHVLKEKLAEREAKKRKPDTKLDETAEEDDGNWKRRKVSNDEKSEERKDEDGTEVNQQNAEDENIQDGDEEEEEEEGEEEANDDECRENETNEGSELYDPAETFNATDPNDINLNDETLIDKEPMNDEDWKEVDEKLDEILEEEIKTEQETETPVVIKEEPKEQPKEKESPKETPKKEVLTSPVKTSTPAAKPKVNQARKTRARKN